MKLQLVKLGQGVSSAVFFWDVIDEATGKKKKNVQTIAMEEVIEIDDTVGHDVMSAYKGVFRLISYGQEKVLPAPTNKMVKNEKVKDVSES